MRVLVFGGTRFIGRHTVRQLAEDGCDVTVFHRGETEPTELQEVRHLHGDRRDLTQHADDLARLRPDVVVDMMAMTESDARGVVDSVGRHAERVVMISSQDVYRAYAIVTGADVGPAQPVPITEDSELRRGRFPYRSDFPPEHELHDYDKIPAERCYLDVPGVAATILRLPAVYGPHDQQHRTAGYLRRMLDGRSTILLSERLADWRWTRGYVENIAFGIALAVTDERVGAKVYNLGELQPMTEYEWIEAIGRAVGWGGDIRTLPDADLPAELRLDVNHEQHLVTDSSRIRRDLGFEEVVDRDEAMARTVVWESGQPHGGSIDYSAEDAVLD